MELRVQVVWELLRRAARSTCAQMVWKLRTGGCLLAVARRLFGSCCAQGVVWELLRAGGALTTVQLAFKAGKPPRRSRAGAQIAFEIKVLRQRYKSRALLR